MSRPSSPPHRARSITVKPQHHRTPCTRVYHVVYYYGLFLIFFRLRKTREYPDVYVFLIERLARTESSPRPRRLQFNIAVAEECVHTYVSAKPDVVSVSDVDAATSFLKSYIVYGGRHSETSTFSFGPLVVSCAPQLARRTSRRFFARTKTVLTSFT